MTDLAASIARAKKALDAAIERHDKTVIKDRNAVRAARDRHGPAIRKAVECVRICDTEVTRLKLLQHGIVPMHTIFRLYIPSAKWAYWTVKIVREGYNVLLPVTDRNKVHGGRNEYRGYVYFEKVQITDRVLKLEV